MFGMSTEERRRYEADMQQLRAQQETEIRMLQRQAQLQGAIQGANITTSDYRGQYSGNIVSGSDISTILRNTQRDMREMRDEMIKLRGFYEWMIHAYPETIAQYKALMDLQRAASSNNSEAGEQSVASSY
jgi:hypothetical protein